MTRPQAVLFDLDGTLLDSAPAITQALNAVLRARGGEPVTIETVRPLVSRGAEELVAKAFGSLAITPARDLADFRAVYGALAPDPADLYPGASETLHALALQGVRLAVCTNKPQSLTEKLLDGLKIRAPFTAVLGGDAVPRAKPHPDHLLAALTLLAVPPADAVYVGDSEVDGEAAKRAGIAFILVSYGYATSVLSDIPHQARIDRLDGLPALLPNVLRLR